MATEEAKPETANNTADNKAAAEKPAEGKAAAEKAGDKKAGDAKPTENQAGEKSKAAPKEAAKAATPAPAAPTAPAKEEKPSKLKLAMAEKTAQAKVFFKSKVAQLKAINFKALIAQAASLPGLFISYAAALPKILLTSKLSTKIMAMGLVTSATVCVYMLIQLTNLFFPQLFVKKPHADSAVNREIANYFKERQDYKEAQEKIVGFESFTSSVQSEKGNINAYEVEFYIECDSPGTSRYIEAKKPEFREVVASALQDQVFEVLLTETGKDLLKAHIASKLNEKIQKDSRKGKVERVFFTKFIMG